MNRMHDPDVSTRINSFLSRKARRFPELDLEHRTTAGTWHDREGKTWKFSQLRLPHQPFVHGM